MMHRAIRQAGEEARAREINAGRMPLWRYREILLGIARGLIWHRVARRGRLPIIHGGVKIRRRFAEVELGHLSEFHERVVLSAIGTSEIEPARLTIGPLTSIWYGTVISARQEISIGRECAISWNCTIIDNDMHRIIYSEEDSGKREPRPGRVWIGDHVWVGASAVILKGVQIGDHSIVAAGSVVTEDILPKTLVAGAPARTIRQIETWK